MALASKVDNGGTTVEIRFGTGDPSSGGGEAAPLGSIYQRTDGTLWWKSGAADTAWTLLVKLRTVASGSTTVAAASTSVLGPFTRNANERLTVTAFITDNVAGAIAVPDSVAIAASDIVQYWVSRTANANELNLNLRNNNALVTRTVDWQVLASTP